MFRKLQYFVYYAAGFLILPI